MSLRLYSAASGVLRDAHYVLNPVTGLYERTTLIEPARTNGWTYSEDLSQGVWGVVRATKGANAAIAPDGEFSADKLVEDATAANSHYMGRNWPTATDDTKQPLTVFAKAAERSEIRIVTGDKAGASKGTWFDLSTGTVGTSTHTDGARVHDAGNGWYRCEVIFDVASGGGTPAMQVFLGEGGETATYDGDGSSGVYLWGLQAETDGGAVGSSYMPTDASTFTRNADVAYLDFTAAPQEMTVYARFFELGAGLASGNPRLWMLPNDTGGTDAWLGVIGLGTGEYRAIHDNGSNQSVSDSTTLGSAYGNLVEIRVTLSAAGAVQLHHAKAAGSETSESAGTAYPLASSWPRQRFYLGSNNGSNVTVAAFTHVYAWAGTKALAECRSLAGVT